MLIYADDHTEWVCLDKPHSYRKVIH